MAGFQDQQWEPVVLRKNKPPVGSTPQDINAARRAGAQIGAVKKGANS